MKMRYINIHKASEKVSFATVLKAGAVNTETLQICSIQSCFFIMNAAVCIYHEQDRETFGELLFRVK